MAIEYPYMISNNKIKPIFDAILQAAKPPKFSQEFLKQLGFFSSNDRAIIRLLRRLGFINENGVPTEYYNDLKDKTKRDYVIGQRFKELYSDLYTVNTEIHNASDDDIKGAMSRVTGKDATTVNRYFSTFKALASIAKFDGTATKVSKKAHVDDENKEEKTPPRTQLAPAGAISSFSPDFHYNIQIHLPATSDISVYNAIFKSLKDNILG